MHGNIICKLVIAGAIVVSSSAGAFALPDFGRPTEAFPQASPAEKASYHHHHHHFGAGYVINRNGFGNYHRGPNGSFGGYPAGSAGAKELQQNQEDKCRGAPETC